MIGAQQPLITTQEDVWGKATWRGEGSLLSKLPCEVHWKPTNCGRSSLGPTMLDPSLQVQLPPQSPTLHPPPHDLLTAASLLGQSMLVSAPKEALKVKLFPAALCCSHKAELVTLCHKWWLGSIYPTDLHNLRWLISYWLCGMALTIFWWTTMAAAW